MDPTFKANAPQIPRYYAVLSFLGEIKYIDLELKERFEFRKEWNIT